MFNKKYKELEKRIEGLDKRYWEFRESALESERKFINIETTLSIHRFELSDLKDKIEAFLKYFKLKVYQVEAHKVLRKEKEKC